MPEAGRRRTSGAALYFHTLRHLRLRQLIGRAWYSAARPGLPGGTAPPRRPPVASLVPGCRRAPSMVGAREFRFLNRDGALDGPESWNDPNQPKLWIYNLHYFDDLNSECARGRCHWHVALVSRWIRENPPAVGNGWEPYPTSLRIVNWIKWDLTHGALDQEAVDSLALQLRWLRKRLEYHLLGNHLLANAKALVFGGLYFAGQEAEGWFRKGLDLLERELSEQVLTDGGHFELSPMYQLIVLEDLLDLINLCRAYGRSVPEAWCAAARAMLAWAWVMRHPDGEIPYFNDSAAGVAPAPTQLDRYAAGLDLSPSFLPREGLNDLPSSGYARLDLGTAVVFVDLAPVGPDYLPGHAHADSLSFELSLEGRRVFVNCGTSEYGIGPRRQWERGTSAHTTVLLDDADSSEVWAGFRVARRARIVSRRVEGSGGRLRAQGAHDGYKRLPGRPVHHREWDLTTDGMRVSDRIAGGGSHSATAWLHLHPEMRAAPAGDDAVDVCRRDGAWVCRVRFTGGGCLSVKENRYALEFGRLVPIHSLCFRVDRADLPLTLVTDIRWAEDNSGEAA